MVALGGKTSEIWDKRDDHDVRKMRKAWRKASRLMRGHGDETAASHIPWPILRDDVRVLRVADPIASMEALQTLRKKQYEEERCSSNGARIPRCPFKGAAGYDHKSGVRRRSRASNSNTVSPVLFTIPNFLTPGDCERFITASELRGFRHQLSYGRGSYASWDIPNDNDLNKMWTPGLKAVFEGMRVEGEGDAFAVGVPYFYVSRYENGERCEPHSHDMLYRQLSGISPHFYTFDGYRVLVYLSGSQADADSHTGSPRDVVGGETHVFYSRQHLSGNSKKYIAKIAPEAGLAVCIACGQRSPVHEIRPVANGVLYMIEFFVQFSNFTEKDVLRYMESQSQSRKGQRKLRSM